jgi:uncharacterized SAM-binding protein YcdF (DUF218 family)
LSQGKTGDQTAFSMSIEFSIGRRLGWLLVACAMGGLLIAGLLHFPRTFMGSDDADASDMIVVLAGGAWTKARVERGIDLLKAGVAHQVLASGVEFDPGHSDFNADAWRHLQAHLSSGQLIIDPVSRTTKETAIRCFELASRKGWRRLTIVTSDFHWRRTRLIFRNEMNGTCDIRVVTVPSYPRTGWWQQNRLRKLILNECQYILGYALFSTLWGKLFLCCVAAVLLVVKARQHGERLKI